MTDAERTTNAEAELANLFAKYEPSIAKLGKTLRAKLRGRLPGLSEIVYFYANQSSLVISYSPTENGYEAVCTLALYPSEVKLFFAQSPLVAKADTQKLLQGSGKVVRHVVLDAAAAFDRAEIQALIAAALEHAKVRPDPRANGALILKAGEQKQRAARAKKAPRAPRSTSTTRKTKSRR